MKTPTVKLTTLALWALIASIGALGGMKYENLRIAADRADDSEVLQQAGFKPALPVFIEAPIEREQQVNKQRGL